MHARGAGGHAGQAAQAAVDMLDGLRVGRPVVLQHVLDQVDAAARAVELVAQHLVGRAGRGAEPAMDAGAQDLVRPRGVGIPQLLGTEICLHAPLPSSLPRSPPGDSAWRIGSHGPARASPRRTARFRAPDLRQELGPAPPRSTQARIMPSVRGSGCRAGRTAGAAPPRAPPPPAARGGTRRAGPSCRAPRAPVWRGRRCRRAPGARRCPATRAQTSPPPQSSRTPRAAQRAATLDRVAGLHRDPPDVALARRQRHRVAHSAPRRGDRRRVAVNLDRRRTARAAAPARPRGRTRCRRTPRAAAACPPRRSCAAPDTS